MASENLIKEYIDFLSIDIPKGFTGQGMDFKRYDENIEFEDPATKVKGLPGYIRNIDFLNNAFDVEFYIHGIRPLQGTDDEIQTRWTMIMKLKARNYLPYISMYWQPILVFTGESFYRISFKTKKIIRHVDTWDNVSNQKYFSVEGFLSILSQMATVQQIPNLQQPENMILRYGKEYQLREYKPFLVAEVEQQNKSTQVNVQSFKSLTGYLFGQNKEQQKMSMTIPVINSSDGKVQIFLGPKDVKDINDAPTPLDKSVATNKHKGGYYAVSEFRGTATDFVASREEQSLRIRLRRDGLQPQDGYLVARYNDPRTPNILKKNEVLIPVQKFNVWPNEN